MPSSKVTHNIVEIPVETRQTVESFEPSKLKDRKGVRYSNVKADFRKPESEDERRKNARFQLSELSRVPMSVAEEEEARVEEEVRRRVSDRIETLSAEATKHGYKEGFAAGKQDAKKEVLSQARPVVEAFESLVREFEGMKHDIFRANEEFLIRMVYRITKAVILREVKEDKEYAKRLITGILERLGIRENVKIYVSAEVFSSAEVLKEDLAKSLGELKNVSVESDPEIVDKGCRVETDFGEVDARIEVQLQSIANGLGVTQA